MSRIQVQRGYLSDGDAQHSHLIQNHLLDEKANIDKFVMYAEKRYLTTLLVSGARESRFTAPAYTPKGRQAVTTKIKPLSQSKKIAQKGYAFKVMGRIQKEVEVIGTAGTPTQGTATQGGTFSLYLGDNTIKKGMNVLFSNNKHARVKTLPTRQGQKWLYRFECYPGDTFNYTTWVVPASGRRTVFAGYSTYGERSKRGFATFFYPDTYIQHTTIQRKSFSMSGDVMAEEVRWYSVDGEKKGFVFEAEAQMRAQFLLEDEHQKWWGKSTMKDAYGNLLDRPAMIEEDDGEEIWAGDGLYEQTKGINDMETSGVNGAATYQDMADMVDRIKRHMDTTGGDPIIVVTGREGMANAAIIAKQEAQSSNVYYTIDAKNNMKVGGMDVEVGYNFQVLNIAGEQLLFVENPQWNDKLKYPGTLSNGKSKMGSTFFFSKWGPMGDGRNNMEIMARGRNGVDRNMVYLTKNGMTGFGPAEEPTDAISFHMLKENLMIVYDPRLSGWMEPSATA